MKFFVKIAYSLFPEIEGVVVLDLDLKFWTDESAVRNNQPQVARDVYELE